MPALLPPDFAPTPEQLRAYEEGWEIGRTGRIDIPAKYPETSLADPYYQGFYDAQAGRDKSINQPRTYEDQ